MLLHHVSYRQKCQLYKDVFKAKNCTRDKCCLTLDVCTDVDVLISRCRGSLEVKGGGKGDIKKGERGREKEKEKEGEEKDKEKEKKEGGGRRSRHKGKEANKE